MMNFKNEEAVSPVIGVILMVAITVILAAVIAAFVFGMTGNVQTQKTVAVTVGQNGDNVVLTYHGGADAATLDYLTVTVTPGDDLNNPVTKYIYSDTDGEATMTGTFSALPAVESRKTLPVGASVVLSGGSDKQDHVVVTGHFADGSDQVVLDTYV